MIFKRIDENTLSCTISPEDLRERGFSLDDFFEKKKEAVDFIRSVVAEAARAENFDMEGQVMMMRVSVLPDHSLNLLITRENPGEGIAKQVRRIAQSIMESISARSMEEDSGQEEKDPVDDLVGALLGTEKEKEPGGDTAGTGRTEKEPDTKDERGSAAGNRRKGADFFMFSFYTIRDAMDCCRVFAGAGEIDSALYYLREDDTYFLILHKNGFTPEGYERQIISANDFGELVTSNEKYISFVTEHGIPIVRENAIEQLLSGLPKKKKKSRARRKGNDSGAAAGAASTQKVSGAADGKDPAADPAEGSVLPRDESKPAEENKSSQDGSDTADGRDPAADPAGTPEG